MALQALLVQKAECGAADWASRARGETEAVLTAKQMFGVGGKAVPSAQRTQGTCPLHTDLAERVHVSTELLLKRNIKMQSRRQTPFLLPAPTSPEVTVPFSLPGFYEQMWPQCGDKRTHI